MTTEWAGPSPSRIWRPAQQFIVTRRRQLLVHSCIYYALDSNLVSDHQWQEWADELAWRQDDFGWQAGFYDAAFRGWDGSSGYHLPHRDHDVMRVAQRLLAQARPQRRGFF